MNATLLGRQFQMNHWATHANLQEMSHADSLVHPAPGGNCFNWVLGHIVSTRNAVLAALGETPIWTGTKDLPYRRGSPAPLAAVEAQPLETLVAAYDASQASVERALDRLTDADAVSLAATRARRAVKARPTSSRRARLYGAPVVCAYTDM